MTTQFPLSGPLSVGDLLDRAFRLYRARFGLFLLIAMLFLVPSAIISGLALELYYTEPAYGDAPEYFDESTFFRNATLYVSIIVLQSLTFQGIAALALVVQCVQNLYGNSPTSGYSICRGLRRLLAYVGMMVFVWAVLLTVTAATTTALLLGVSVLEISTGVVTGVLDRQSVETLSYIEDIGLDFLIIFSFVGLVLFSLVPAFYLRARWLAAPAALIAEELGPLTSLRRSWRLAGAMSAA